VCFLLSLHHEGAFLRRRWTGVRSSRKSYRARLLSTNALSSASMIAFPSNQIGSISKLLTFLLLQAHFSRLQLPPNLAADQVLVLEEVLNLLSACVDVMSSNAWMNALGAMDLSQMCVGADEESYCSVLTGLSSSCWASRSRCSSYGMSVLLTGSKHCSHLQIFQTVCSATARRAKSTSGLN